jgi:2-polyprenyl-3-methyl-5-hydroxy-6-metoxy-1,4-benzoquinol methylase
MLNNTVSTVEFNPHEKAVGFRAEFLDVGPRFQMRKRIFLKMLHGESGRLIDVGCGEGYLLRELSHLNFECAGIDISADAIERAHEILQNTSVNVRVQDLWDLPADEPFDVITCGEVIEHIEDDRRFIQGLARILKPGGALVASVPIDMRLWDEIDAEGGHYRRYEVSEFQRLLQGTGFVIEQTVVWGWPLTRWLYRRIRLQQFKSAHRGQTQVQSRLRRIKPFLKVASQVFLIDNLFNATRRGVGVIVKARKTPGAYERKTC